MIWFLAVTGWQELHTQELHKEMPLLYFIEGLRLAAVLGARGPVTRQLLEVQ
jgi:hypothetical protein